MQIRAPLLAALLLAWIPAASAADPIGSAVRVLNQVTAEANQAARSLATGDGVNQDEIIAVGANSLGELRLEDETKLALGPGARLKLDTFVYDPAKGSGTIAVDLTKGAFRFITGVARKPSYLIRSPNASISVRGTIFDVYVDPAGTMWLLLHEGSIEVCNSRGECHTLDDPCEVMRVGPGGDLSGAATWNRQPDVREISFETAFPFVVRPPQVDPAPRHTRALVETGTCPAAERDPTVPAPTRRAETYEPAEPVARAPTRAKAETQDEAAPPADHAPPRGYEPDGVPPPIETADDGGYDDANRDPGYPEVVTETILTGHWGGFYVGLHAGATFGTENVDIGCYDPDRLYDLVTTDCSDARRRGYLPSDYDVDDKGFSGGGAIGFNLQTGPLVLGLETDITRMSTSGNSEKRGTDFPTPYDTGSSVRQELQWLGTVRGRVGLAAGNALLFATAGMAYGEVDMAYDLYVRSTRDFAKVEDSKTMVGWTAGGGAELGLGKVSLKGEYMYFDLGEEELDATFTRVGGGPPGATTATFKPEFETRGHTARFGINFHLN